MGEGELPASKKSYVRFKMEREKHLTGLIFKKQLTIGECFVPMNGETPMT